MEESEACLWYFCSLNLQMGRDSYFQSSKQSHWNKIDHAAGVATEHEVVAVVVELEDSVVASALVAAPDGSDDGGRGGGSFAGPTGGCFDLLHPSWLALRATF